MGGHEDELGARERGPGGRFIGQPGADAVQGRWIKARVVWMCLGLGLRVNALEMLDEFYATEFLRGGSSIEDGGPQMKGIRRRDGSQLASIFQCLLGPSQQLSKVTLS